MNNIDILEELIEYLKEYGDENYQEYCTAIKNLIAENKELKEKNKEIEEEDVKIRAKFILQLDNYIPKSKVEELLELEKDLYCMEDKLFTLNDELERWVGKE